MFTVVKEVWQRRELLAILVGRNLKIRYKNSALGFLWSLLGPILMILIYAVFARILRFSDGIPHYVQFLVVGLVAWQFHVMCLNDSLHAIMGNVSLVKKTRFPRIILPLATVLANLVNFLLTGVVVVLYLLLARITPGNLGLLPLTILTQIALCLGAGLIIATVNVFFRDTEHVLGAATLAWFFLTPVFYPLEFQMRVLPPHAQWLAFLNPMNGIVCAYRAALMKDEALWAPGGTQASFAVAWAILLLGIWIFGRFQARFGDEL